MRSGPVLERALVLTEAEIAATVDAIENVQLAGGCIPWYPGGHADPWDHVEAAMALTVGGRIDRAEAAYAWMARTQQADGAWATAYDDQVVADPTLDANFTA